MESLKFANFVFEIDMARDDEKLHEVIIKGKKLNKKLLSEHDVLSLDYLLSELHVFLNLEKNKRHEAYRLMDKIHNTLFIAIKNNSETNIEIMENDIKHLSSYIGLRSYWMYSSKINLIALKIDKNKTSGILGDINLLIKFLESEKIDKGMISSAAFGLYSFYYEKIADWKNCEKYALEALGAFPKGFDESYISTPASLLLKSSYMLSDFDKFEKYKKLLSDNYITTINLSEHRPLFRINETMAKYYFQKGKLTNAISHQELALAFISFRFPKDSEEVKAVAADLRNMLKQNNEIQAMRNLEERYNLKPLP